MFKGVLNHVVAEWMPGYHDLKTAQLHSFLDSTKLNTRGEATLCHGR